MPKTSPNIHTFSPDEIAKAKQIIQPAENILQQLSLITNGSGQPLTVHLRDGEVVLYKRERSDVWQARLKLHGSKFS